MVNEDGSIILIWDAVGDVQSYLIHYGGANQAEPIEAVNLGYSETNSWNLVAGDVPELTTGDEIYLYVQAYREKGVGATDAEKARFLHDGPYTGSDWSTPTILTKD